uniref:Uncharacterized protein n=1 Tax=Spongospora subterranea TaxID=70186 RepID=A0A0H5R8I7_9EUKA|eukprot:CRZ10435.1 hypothetical protein [Spongospora subterranea]
MENIEIKHSNTLDRGIVHIMFGVRCLKKLIRLPIPKSNFFGRASIASKNPLEQRYVNDIKTCKKANHISGEIAPQKKRSNDQKLAVEQKSVILKAKGDRDSYETDCS